MGIIKCPEHGDQFTREVCHHFQKKILKFEKLDELVKVIKDTTFSENGAHLYYCSACWKKLPIPQDGIINPDNENFWDFHENISGVCKGCWAKYIQTFPIEITYSFKKNE